MKKLNLRILSLYFLGSTFFYALQAQTQRVKISTEYGDMVAVLYDETPGHRDNFLKLAKEGFYDGTIFHRVIKDFMIQGGDPQSKNATPEAALGNGGPGYTIPAEINAKYYHKKGALAAARLGDNINPKKESSGSQFYIVHGNKFTPQVLGQMQDRKNNAAKSKLTREFLNDPANAAYMDRLKKLQEEKNQEGIQALFKEVDALTASKNVSAPASSYNEQQIKTYSEVGGTPHLDGDYTVFGEIVEGLDVIDKIAAVEKGNADRPKKDIKMKITLLP